MHINQGVDLGRAAGASQPLCPSSDVVILTQKEELVPTCGGEFAGQSQSR